MVCDLQSGTFHNSNDQRSSCGEIIFFKIPQVYFLHFSLYAYTNIKHISQAVIKTVRFLNKKQELGQSSVFSFHAKISNLFVFSIKLFHYIRWTLIGSL